MSEQTEPFSRRNLPDYPAPTVTLFRDQLVRFRGDYKNLMEFCAFILEVDVRKMCNADFGIWLRGQDEDTIRRAPQWVREAAAFIEVMRDPA